MLPPVVECSDPDEVIDVILFEEVEHGIITRCTDREGNVVAEIDLMQTAVVGFADRMLLRVRPHPWAWNIAKQVHAHASVEEEQYVGKMPMKASVVQSGWNCSYMVAVEWGK